MEPTPPPESPRDPVQRMGVGMMTLFWLVAGLIAVIGFSGLLERKHNPNADPDSSFVDGRRQVVLKAGRYGHYVAGGSINGHPVTFMVDTGASTVALSQSLADRIGLRAGQGGISSTAAGRVRVYNTQLSTVKLGNIEQRDVSASIVPAMEQDEVLLGMSFLRTLEVSHKDGMLTITQ